MKHICIIGDSYSTYEGYIPEGYHFYYSDEREEPPVVRGMEKTWWNIMANETGFQVVLNDSFSGSSICNTVRENLAVESSFISRMDRYIAENFFAENDIHTMLIFGGTNDSWIHAPVGVPQYSDWSADALKCVLPAFCYLLDRAKTVVEDIVVIINTNLKAEIVNGMVEACEKMAVQYLRLTEIDKQHSHPTELGMKQIAEQVVEFLHTR